MTACSCVLAVAISVLGQTSNLTPTGAISDGLGAPTRLAAAPGGGLYVTDQVNGQVLEYDNTGTLVNTYAVPEMPVGIAVIPSSGNVIVSRRDGAVGVYDNAFNLLGSLDPAPLAFVTPNDIAVHPTSEEIYVVDSDAHQVMVFNPNTNALARMWGAQGVGLGQFESPQAIAIDATNDRVLVADVDNFRVQVFDTTGVFQFKFGYRTLYAGSGEVAWFARSEGLALDACGNIYITDALMGTVRAFTPAGKEISATFIPAVGYGANAGQLRTPCDVMIDAAGTLYVANTTNANIETFQVGCTAAPLMARRSRVAQIGGRDVASNPLNYPDNPLDIVNAIRSGEYEHRLDINTDRVVDETDLELAVARFGGASVEDFLNMDTGPRAAYPYPLQPPHMVAELPNLCGRCHSMDGLPNGMLSAEGQTNLCVSCHTPGGRAMASPIEAGDDANSHPWGVVANPGPDPESELALHLDNGDVRCATCHDPHETMYAGAPYLRGSLLDGGLCAECHTEVAEWQHAGHADESADPWGHYDWSLASRAACRQCHSGNGYIDFSKGLPAAEQNGNFRVLDCVVCHATHGKPQDETLLRIYGEITLPTEGPDETITGVGAMATCMACHNGRVAPDDGSLTPHYAIGGVMLEGINGNTYGFKLVNSPHTQLANCIDCHMYPTPGPGEPGAGKIGGHTFNMKVHDPNDPDFGVENIAACNAPACHGNTTRAPSLEITEFNREAFGDYDGDGTIEGVQDETQGLMDLVYDQITTNGAVFLGSYPYWSVTGVVDNPPGFVEVVKDAIWNWEYVDNSGDLGIHNTSYAVGLLQVTYRALSGHDVPGAFLRYETPATMLPKTVVQIQGVNGGAPVEPGGTFTVDFTIEDDQGNPIAKADLNRLQLYVAGPASNYQLVIPSDGNSANFVQNPDDSYTYTLPTPFPTVYSPPLFDSPAFGAADGELTGQPLLDGTYTVLIESRRVFGSVRKAGDATMDFVVANNPGSPPALASRELITQAACNACHNDLQLHGSNRYSVKGCVVCHTAGGEDLITTPDSTPGVTIQFDDMIHRIHRSHDLPTITATANSADPYRYIITGYGGSSNDFSDIGFPILPDGVMNCDACHAGAAQGAEVYNRITRANCVGCHTDIDFTTGTILDKSNPDVQDGLLTQADLSNLAYRIFPGGVDHSFANDTTCSGCHGPGMFANVEDAHLFPSSDAAEGTNPYIEIVSVGGMTGGGGTYFQAGDFFEVTFKLANDVNNPQELLAGNTGILDRMEVIVTGPTTLYQQIMGSQRPWSNGNLAVPVGNWIDNYSVDGTYTFISEDPFPAVYPAQENALGEPPAEQIFSYAGGWGQQYSPGGTPLDAGTYNIVMFGRRLTPIAGEREPVITGTFDVQYGVAGPAVPYNGTVDTASCNACHGVLAFHGNQRYGVESCFACHTAGSQDGGTMESVDLRIMVHKLHNARNLEVLPYELNGHSGIADFSDLLISSMPGEAAECQVCHVNDAWENPPMRDNMRTWMVACTSCHNGDETRTHVNAATLAGTFVETCTACHGPGTAWSVAKVHGTP